MEEGTEVSFETESLEKSRSTHLRERRRASELAKETYRVVERKREVVVVECETREVDASRF